LGLDLAKRIKLRSGNISFFLVVSLLLFSSKVGRCPCGFYAEAFQMTTGTYEVVWCGLREDGHNVKQVIDFVVNGT